MDLKKNKLRSVSLEYPTSDLDMKRKNNIQRLECVTRSLESDHCGS
jgi:hypothetical protein